MSETARALGLPGEIEWKGRTLQISRVYFKIEALFELWLERNLDAALERARKTLSADAYRDRVNAANVQAATRAFAWDSEATTQAAWGQAGFKELAYLCIADKQPGWSRAEHDELMSDPEKVRELIQIIHKITAPVPNGSPPAEPAGGSS